jgi:dihydrodipicolinate synthase/N-acetylneuraminate lyase
MAMNGSVLLGGIIPPLVTPLKGQDLLDHDGFENLITHTLSGGVSGLFVLGTTGEGASLSRELKLEIISLACRYAAGRVPLLVGITDAAFGESVRLAKAAADAGGAAVVAAPPYYFRYSQSDLLQYVERLASAAPLPLVLYNIPQYTKVPYAVETVRRASQLRKVVGVKDSSGDLAYFADVVRAVSQNAEFGVSIGPEEQLVDGLRAGACGGVSGGANLFPHLYVSAYNAAQRGDWDEADRLQQMIRRASALLYRVGDPDSSYLRGLKAALSVEGVCSDLPALPFSRFTAAEREFVRRGVGEIRTAMNDSAVLSRR